MLTHHVSKVLLAQHSGDAEQLLAPLAEKDDRRRTIDGVPPTQLQPRLPIERNRSGAGDIDLHRQHTPPQELLHPLLVDHRVHLVTPVAPLLKEEEHPRLPLR